MKCIIYSRVSTTEQNLENQVNQLKSYAATQNWQVIKIITDISSGGKSAKERSGLNEVLQMSRKRQCDIILFWSLDRFSREGSRKTLEYLIQLDSFGVKWHSFTEPYISSLGIFSDAIIAILSALAKQERIRISERTIAGLNRVRGKVTLGRPRTSLKQVQKAVALREEGMPYSKIGNILGLSKSRAYQLCNKG